LGYLLFDNLDFHAGRLARGNETVITGVSNSASGEGAIAPATYVSISAQNFAPAGFVDDWSKSVIDANCPARWLRK
jgi:hypothetical protein